MSDTDSLTDQQVLALTALGESDSLGADGMTGTILTVLNRVALNHTWLGGNTIRGVCLKENQYDVWWPETGNPDRARVLNIAGNTNNDTDPNYGIAMALAADGIAGNLVDVTSGAVSYYDPPARPRWAVGKTPCYVEGTRNYYNYESILA